MGSRGPRPKSEQERQAQTDLLKVTAQSWATFFYALRDGEPGVGQRVEWGDWEEMHGIGKLGPGEIAQLGSQEDGTLRIRKAKRIVAINLIPLDIPLKAQQKVFRELKKSEDIVVSMLVPPSPELWRQFQNARNLAAHRKAVGGLEKWWKNRYGTHEGSLLPVPLASESVKTSKDEFRALASRALFDAKKLWLYPSTDRPKSDDKRIEFFAKAAAGLLHGIAPATALRKLTGLQFPKDLVEKQRREFVQRMQAEIKSRRVKP